MCGCPIDWVCCYKADCPRKAGFEMQWKLQQLEALRLLGDPRKGISQPSIK